MPSTLLAIISLFTSVFVLAGHSYAQFEVNLVAIERNTDGQFFLVIDTAYPGAFGVDQESIHPVSVDPQTRYISETGMHLHIPEQVVPLWSSESAAPLFTHAILALNHSPISSSVMSEVLTTEGELGTIAAISENATRQRINITGYIEELAAAQETISQRRGTAVPPRLLFAVTLRNSLLRIPQPTEDITIPMLPIGDIPLGAAVIMHTQHNALALYLDENLERPILPIDDNEYWANGLAAYYRSRVLDAYPALVPYPSLAQAIAQHMTQTYALREGGYASFIGPSLVLADIVNNHTRMRNPVADSYRAVIGGLERDRLLSANPSLSSSAPLPIDFDRINLGLLAPNCSALTLQNEPVPGQLRLVFDRRPLIP